MESVRSASNNLDQSTFLSNNDRSSILIPSDQLAESARQFTPLGDDLLLYTQKSAASGGRRRWDANNTNDRGSDLEVILRSQTEHRVTLITSKKKRTAAKGKPRRKEVPRN